MRLKLDINGNEIKDKDHVIVVMGHEGMVEGTTAQCFLYNPVEPVPEEYPIFPKHTDAVYVVLDEPWADRGYRVNQWPGARLPPQVDRSGYILSCRYIKINNPLSDEQYTQEDEGLFE